MLPPLLRMLQRYFVPGVAVSAYYFLKYRSLVSPAARVQLSSVVSFGRGTVVKPYAVITTHLGRISFGRECAVSSFDHISTGDGDIIIGDYVRVAPNVTIVGGTKEFKRKDVPILQQGESSRRGVRIGDDVLLGAGAVILPGCSVGRGAVVGAGSVVQGDVAEYAIVAGVPAQVIGQRE
ncbi:MAG: acyltransferase [Acidobacteriota bacterium]